MNSKKKVLLLRLPPKVVADVDKMAAVSHRSRTAEIVVALENHLKQSDEVKELRRVLAEKNLILESANNRIRLLENRGMSRG